MSIEAAEEMERRVSFNLGAAIRPFREGHLFDHFLVVGLPQSLKVIDPDQIYKPEIIFEFSGDDKPLENREQVQICYNFSH